MLDAELPRSKWAVSLAVAGTLDVVLGGFGLLLAYFIAIAVGLAVWATALVIWSHFLFDGAFPFEPDWTPLALGMILANGAVILTSMLADYCLLVMGIQLLQHSPRARRTSWLFVGLMIPLGTLDVLAATHFGTLRWLVLGCVLALPLYSVLQLAAFFVLPAWRALNRRSSITT